METPIEASGGEIPTPSDPPKRKRGQHRDGCECSICLAKQLAAQKKTAQPQDASAPASPVKTPGDDSGTSLTPKSTQPLRPSKTSPMAKKIEGMRRERQSASPTQKANPTEPAPIAAAPPAKADWFAKLFGGWQPILAEGQS